MNYQELASSCGLTRPQVWDWLSNLLVRFFYRQVWISQSWTKPWNSYRQCHRNNTHVTFTDYHFDQPFSECHVYFNWIGLIFNSTEQCKFLKIIERSNLSWREHRMKPGLAYFTEEHEWNLRNVTIRRACHSRWETLSHRFGPTRQESLTSNNYKSLISLPKLLHLNQFFFPQLLNSYDAGKSIQKAIWIIKAPELGQYVIFLSVFFKFAPKAPLKVSYYGQTRKLIDA